MIPRSPEARRFCPACGRRWTGRATCRCGQLASMPVGVLAAPAGRRLGALLIDTALAVATLLVGWMIWSFLLYDRGQTPGKALLGMRVIHLEDGSGAGFATMFLREWVGKALLGTIAALVTLGLSDLALLWTSRRQQLWDGLLRTTVIEDRRGA